MKKTVLISLAALAIVTAAVWNVTQSTTSQSNEFDELTLANIEALADTEYMEGYDIRDGPVWLVNYTSPQQWRCEQGGCDTCRF